MSSMTETFLLWISAPSSRTVANASFSRSLGTSLSTIAGGWPARRRNPNRCRFRGWSEMTGGHRIKAESRRNIIWQMETANRAVSSPLFIEFGNESCCFVGRQTDPRQRGGLIDHFNRHFSSGFAAPERARVPAKKVEPTPAAEQIVRNSRRLLGRTGFRSHQRVTSTILTSLGPGHRNFDQLGFTRTPRPLRSSR